jgi:hypothetical protein
MLYYTRNDEPLALTYGLVGNDQETEKAMGVYDDSIRIVRHTHKGFN